MNRPRMSTVVRVAVAVVVVAGAMVVVREVFRCTPPDEQADMIELFEADPLTAAAPHDGQLVDEHSRTYACDSGLPHGSSPTGPGFAEVMRLYTTPAVYSYDQLRQRFDEPAVVGGWRTEEDWIDHLSYPRVLYCKQSDGRASRAYVSSTIHVEVVEEPPAPAVRVRLAAGQDGTRCDVDNGGQ